MISCNLPMWLSNAVVVLHLDMDPEKRNSFFKQGPAAAAAAAIALLIS